MRRALLAILACITACTRTNEPAPAPVAPPAGGDDPVAEVIANIRNQPVGDHTLADYDLPEPFLRRIADRIIRDSFHDRFYAVYDDGLPLPPVLDAPITPARDAATGARLVSVVSSALPPERLAELERLTEGRPALRGFRADDPILSSGAAALPGAELVGAFLARDGLLVTLAKLIERVGPEALLADDALVLARLRAAGLPVDLLAYFRTGTDAATGSAIGVIRHVAERIAGGTTGAVLANELAAWPFVFAPSDPGFMVNMESDNHAIGMVRAQLTRGGYWQSLGEGSSVDILRQLVERLPDADFVVSIEGRFLDEIVPLMGAWPLAQRGRLTLIAEPLTVAQWAQDNGKAGVSSPTREWTTIVPRYASRRDDGSVFVPGESSVADGLAAAGMRIVRSPLLFQGGNLLAVRDPGTGERILLVGEAEIYRNTALGLTYEQVESAFRVEFAVDRCVVLPSVSFHLDYDTSVRAIDGRLVAFVNDPLAGARIVVRCGLDALERHGALRAEDAASARTQLAADRVLPLADILGPVLTRRRDRDGRYPLSLARAFSVGAADSSVGNLQRFMVALDILMCAKMRADELPPAGASRSYLDALRRIDERRRSLHETLRGQSWEILPVPSIAAGGRSINYVNGIHDERRYLMPAYGGLYAPLDAAAAQAFAARLGPGVEVVPVQCAESQRRSGAVHCSVAVYPER